MLFLKPAPVSAEGGAMYLDKEWSSTKNGRVAQEKERRQ